MQKALFIAVATLLSGCALQWQSPPTSSWSADRCRTERWDNTGYQDGAQGQEMTNFERYVARCDTYNVNIRSQFPTWDHHRQKGIVEVYCQADNIKKLADNQRPLLDVCPSYLKDFATRLYQEQKDRQSAKTLIAKQEQEFAQLEQRLQDLTHQNDRYAHELRQELNIRYREKAKELHELKLRHDLCTQSPSDERLCQKYERISRGYGGFYY